MRMRASEIFGLILIGAVSRLVPHIPNMTAIGAVALKGRARFGGRGLLIPLASMTLSDAMIGFYNWKLLLSVYTSFALVGLLGAFLQRTSIIRILTISCGGSSIFFLITNAAVWATSTWYPHTPQGLLACFIAGLPFFYPMLAGDIVFSLILFRFGSVPTLASSRRLRFLDIFSLGAAHGGSRF